MVAREGCLLRQEGRRVVPLSGTSREATDWKVARRRAGADAEPVEVEAGAQRRLNYN